MSHRLRLPARWFNGLFLWAVYGLAPAAPVPGVDQPQALIGAAMAGRLDQVNELLDQGADVNAVN